MKKVFRVNIGMKRRKRGGRHIGMFFVAVIVVASFISGCSTGNTTASDTVVLRVANMEEYIDLGRWDEEIELSDGTVITSENGLIADFEDWYEKTYDQPIRVEYAAVGTNEELYNLMSLGNTFDVVCPSEYMIMKLIEEDRLAPISEDFFDTDVEENYYAKGVSPFITEAFCDLAVDGDPISRYAAGYMWGTMGTVYNPQVVDEKDTVHWSVLCNPKYYRQVTMKDSVRDSLFVALCVLNEKEYLAKDFLKSPDYFERLSDMQNDTSQTTLDKVERVLSDMRRNSYEMETDSGRADMVSEKVFASMQWSGDAVYVMDVADEEDIELHYAVPEEATNLWFDGWVMMKNGLAEDARKQHAAQAFMNFISRPDNVIRNMYYIGYTPVIAGGASDEVFEYLKYCYEAEDEEDAVEYDLSYFFGEDHVVMTTPDQLTRQLYAQYPTKDVIERAVVMRCFDEKARKRVGQMWINVRCFELPSAAKNN